MAKSPPFLTLLPCLLLLFIGLALCLVFNPGQRIASESLSISRSPDLTLVAQLYTPRDKPTPHPVIVLGHGVNNSKAMAAPLAMELARHGIAALTFDFGGFGESYPLPTAEKSIDSLEASTLEDARSVLAWIRDRPERFDLTRIAIGGHSMGGTTALQLGQIDPQLRATVVLSMTGTATPTSPRNLFLGIGAYEQMNSPQDARKMMADAIESPESQNADCFNGRICGNFARGTARQLVVSPTADHVIAPYDARLTARILNWLDRALAVGVGEVSLALPGWILGWGLTIAGSLGAGIWGILQLDRIFAGSRWQRPWQRLWRYGNPVFVSMVAVFLWGYSHPPSANIAANLLLFLYILQLSSNYALGDRLKFPKALRLTGLYALLFEFAAFVPAFVCGLGELGRQPSYWVNLPQFIGQWLLWSGYWMTQLLDRAFFPHRTLELHLSGLFLVLVLWEFLRPGVTLTTLERIVVFGVRWLRRPFKMTTGRITAKQTIGLSVLALILVILLHQRSTDGLLGLLASDGSLVVRQLSLLLLLPLATIVCCLRSPWFRCWEAAAIGGETVNRHLVERGNRIDRR